MSDNNIIGSLIRKLSKYPHIKFEKRNEAELEIFALDDNGFNIVLELGDSEHTLHLGAFHWHYENTKEDIDEMLNQLVISLSGIARVKEFSRKGKPYKWTLQNRDREGNWFDNGTLSLINLYFWKASTVRYLQNHHLSEDLFYDYAEE